MRKRAYRSVSVKKVNLQELFSRLAPGQVTVGVDVAKKELFVSLRDSSGAFQRPWKVQQPSELGSLIECLRSLAEVRPILVAMESTGTYGDCLRQALTDADLVPHRVSAKAVSDYSETFDGVPSNHDGKDAAMIAELAGIGKATPWPLVPSSDWQVKVKRQVQWMDTQQDVLALWLGRLEALLSRHWPELLRLLKLNSATVLQMIAHYGGPTPLASCREAEQRLRNWGRIGLSEEKIQSVLGSARNTVGVRMPQETIQVLQDFAREALRARQEVRKAKKALKQRLAQSRGA